jgi:Recombination endonuclease VII
MPKKCGKCRLDKPLSDFYFRQPTPRNRHGVLSSDCKDCIKARRKSRYHGDPEVKAKAKAYSTWWKRQNPEAEAERRNRPENKAAKRRQALARMYNLTLAELSRLMDAQGDACGICQKPFDAAVACVDHDHSTGTVRGILCHRCNRGIGLLGDDPMILEAAARYLKAGLAA